MEKRNFVLAAALLILVLGGFSYTATAPFIIPTLSVNKTVYGHNATLGTNITFTINVSIESGDVVYNLTFVDYFPSYMDVVNSKIINETNVSDADAIRYNISNTYFWNTTQSINASQILILNITLQITSSPSGNITNFTNFVNVTGQGDTGTLDWFNATAPAVTITGNCTTPSDDLNVNSDTTLCRGFYNINDSVATGVLIINSSNLILDCDGATLNGTDMGYGIYDGGFNNVTVKNCNLKNYNYSIYVGSVVNATVANNNITDSVQYGIFVGWNSTNNTITGNNASSNAKKGIILIESDYNTISENTLSSNQENGLYLHNSSNNNISGNTINSNIYCGVYTFHADNTSFVDNVAKWNNDTAFCINSSSDNYFSGNFAYNNTGDGIAIYDCSLGNSLVGNNLTLDVLGIYVGDNSNDTRIDGNFVTSNTVGIAVYASSHANVTSNTAYSNNVGLAFVYSDYSWAWNNTLTSNLSGEWALGGGYSYLGLSYSLGLALWASSNTTIENNSVSYNDMGLYLLYSPENHILENNLSQNYGYGLFVEGYCNNYIDQTNIAGKHSRPVLYYNDTRNVLVENKELTYGEIYFCNVSNSTIRNVTMNEDDGILLLMSTAINLTTSSIQNSYFGVFVYYDSNNNSLERNDIELNEYGIYLAGANNNTLSGNQINDNNVIGIMLSGSADNRIFDNTVRNNFGGGLNLTDDESTGNSVRRNILCNNSVYDIYANNSDMNSGQDNWCQSAYGWNDFGISGCRITCDGKARFLLMLYIGWNAFSFPVDYLT